MNTGTPLKYPILNLICKNIQSRTEIIALLNYLV